MSRRELLRAGAAAAGGLALACRRERPRPDVVLVTLDTTRADRLGCYGYGRDTTPALDRLAAESTRFETAFASSSWTLPTHATLFTGKFVTSHGARYDADGPLRLGDAIDGFDSYRARGLAEGETTLASLLRASGYRTGAVVAGPWLRRGFGLDRGFDHYDDGDIETINGKRASQVTAAALEWLEDAAGSPTFLFLNYYDPHGPYDAPEPFRHAFGAPDAPTDLYDGEVAYMDHHLGRLLDGMKRMGRYDEALVVVTSDHGELLGEHDRMGHGSTLYQEEIRAPLLVKWPASAGRPPGAVDRRAAHQVDVLPLVLDTVGAAIPPGVQGRADFAGRPLVAEVHPLAFESDEGSWRALISGSMKLVSGERENRLYDLEADPEEHRDLAAERPDVVQRMTSLLHSYLASLPPPGDAGPPRELDPETRELLRSLGYVP